VPDRCPARLRAGWSPGARGPGGSRTAGVVRCWPAVRSACCCGTDDPDQQLIRPDQADREPGRDDRADWSVGPALGHVRGERGDDAEREQPAGQGGYREPVPGRVEVHHRAGVDEAVDRGRLQPGGDAAFAVRADDGVRVPVRDVRRDACHGQDSNRGGHADGPVHSGHRIRPVSGAMASAVTARPPSPGCGGR
jgi:hypothetical protein